jgi:hypothetical protein
LKIVPQAAAYHNGSLRFDLTDYQIFYCEISLFFGRFLWLKTDFYAKIRLTYY